MTVDVAINAYGKPLQTAVTLLSLVRHSGQHIGKIFFTEEAKQPRPTDFRFIYDLLPDRVVVYRPKYWHWCNQTDATRLSEAEYRRSLRYQYAWEESKEDYLFVTHNDVLYTGDIIGEFLELVGDNAGVGEIGQCWNCPASSAGLCSGDSYWSFRPTESQLEALYAEYPANRVGWEAFRDDDKPWPMPECRLNEWAALINLKLCRPATLPLGDAFPFGAMTLDIGTRWFRDMSAKGLTFVNRPLTGLGSHGWVLDGGGGHQALFSRDKYDAGEQAALDLLVREYSIDESILRRAAGSGWVSRLRAIFRRPGRN
jgi:hypothetical protein